jgi:hypothetical protein
MQERKEDVRVCIKQMQKEKIGRIDKRFVRLLEEDRKSED